MSNDNRIKTYEEFYSQVMEWVKECPKDWRKGQSVFNIMDDVGCARVVQYEDGVDCFYNDDNIDDFLKACWKRIDEYQKNEEKKKASQEG